MKIIIIATKPDREVISLIIIATLPAIIKIIIIATKPDREVISLIIIAI